MVCLDESFSDFDARASLIQKVNDQLRNRDCLDLGDGFRLIEHMVVCNSEFGVSTANEPVFLDDREPVFCFVWIHVDGNVRGEEASLMCVFCL